MTSKIYFSDFFNVSTNTITHYGAYDISLISDLPLFIDPFLLFNSTKNEYNLLHENIIKYLKFLRDKSLAGLIDEGLLKSWYTFKEVKQNWLGFSKYGNQGSGLGMDFARALNKNLAVIFNNFGDEKVANGSHLEKLCLIRDGVGKDNISDFATNLINEYLLEYTQLFAQRHIHKNYRGRFRIKKVRFNYTTESWESLEYDLPCFQNNYVLLTPRDILTRDDIWINRNDMIHDYRQIVHSVDNEQLRAQLNNYLEKKLKPDVKDKEKRKIISKLYEKFPETIEYFIRSKEHRGEIAEYISQRKVKESEELFINNTLDLVSLLQQQTSFYDVPGITLNETKERIMFLKDVIENKGGHRIFYVDNEPCRRESDLQIMFRLTWFGTMLDISREVNDGRGPVDFKVSLGAHDKSLVEFKLASNSQLKRNLSKQLEIYKKASDSPTGFKVIIYFTEEEYERVDSILKDLKLKDSLDIILIDGRADNKPSGSKA
ncbi:MAG: hypothetical protein JW828_16555 [Sedimentisphaerales bacterium]|nr:hypothetical protein [Sedimentisphaerales bacterium]